MSPHWLALLPLANNFARNAKRKNSVSFKKPSLYNMCHLTLHFFLFSVPCGMHCLTVPAYLNGHLVHSTLLTEVISLWQIYSNLPDTRA